MDVVRASVLGFCGGVRRAVAMVEDAVERFGTLYTLHEIVHNHHVMERLADKGVILVNSLSEVPDNVAIAITAHGAPQMTISAIQARGLILIDTTCPIVRDAQRVVAENSASQRFTIIFGDRHHLEVCSLLSQAVGSAVATESMEGLEFPSEEGLALVGQTTKSPEALQAFAEDLIARLAKGTDFIIQDTTCPEPVARYHAACELSADVDAMIVIGSPDSANSRNLHTACQKSGRPTLFLESAEDSDLSSFVGQAVIGLTAGASTPDWIIDEVELKLRQL